MGHYPFTLFNGITVCVLALTLLLLWRRFRGALNGNWPLVCYAVIAGYTIGFSGGLNPYWVGAAAACAVAIRWGLYQRYVRWVEAIALVYVAGRCVGLVMMW